MQTSHQGISQPPTKDYLVNVPSGQRGQVVNHAKAEEWMSCATWVIRGTVMRTLRRSTELNPRGVVGHDQWPTKPTEFQVVNPLDGERAENCDKEPRCQLGLPAARQGIQHA